MKDEHSKYKFKPAWWLPGSHLQTLWPSLCRKPLKLDAIRRERFELPDGDFVDLDWLGAEKAPIVLILHGLEGSITSSYANGMLVAIKNAGWRGVLMHFRSCSGELNRHARAYHSGDTHDVACVVRALREREPNTPIAAIGFSLGGNVLLKWLGETGKKNPLTAAVGISVPFELLNASYRVQRGFSRLYQWHFLQCLRKKIQQKIDSQKVKLNLPPLDHLHTLYEFDERVTAPLHGFLSAEDYYSQASCRPYLCKITTPTLVVHAKDDPLMTEDILPQQQEVSPQVMLEVTDRGGHVGFVSGNVPWRAEYWLERRVPEFLKQYLL